MIVEAKPGGPAAIESVPLSAGRPPARRRRARSPSCRRWRASAATTTCACAVKVDGPVPGVAEQVRELLPNALDVRSSTARRAADAAALAPEPLRPAELFADFYRRKQRRRRRRRAAAALRDSLRRGAAAGEAAASLESKASPPSARAWSSTSTALDLFAITGPTGAGKSSLIDALDVRALRPGAARGHASTGSSSATGPSGSRCASTSAWATSATGSRAPLGPRARRSRASSGCRKGRDGTRWPTA